MPFIFGFNEPGAIEYVSGVIKSPVSGPLLSVKKPLIFLITTASSTSERLQPFSQGAPQTFPQIEAKGLVARDIA